jgi:hypothetical protein
MNGFFPKPIQHSGRFKNVRLQRQSWLAFNLPACRITSMADKSWLGSIKRNSRVARGLVCVRCRKKLSRHVLGLPTYLGLSDGDALRIC